MTAASSSKSLTRHATRLTENPSLDARGALDAIALNSQRNFYKNKCRVLEKDLLALRDALGIEAPDNGALLPRLQEIRLQMVTADSLPARPVDEALSRQDDSAVQTDPRMEIARLHKRIDQMSAVMKSPPVQVGRLISSWGRSIKRAVRHMRKPRP